MMSRAALAVLAWVVVEVLLFGWVASLIGVWNVVLISLAASLVGASLVRRSVPGLLRGAVVQQHLDDDRLTLALAGLLLLVPGLASGAVGALLVVPPIRAAVGPRISGRLAQFVPIRRFGARNVVDVDLVNEDMTRPARGSRGTPELG
jgi:UPF0716 family protein affecting phage T7 exclusion